MGLFDTITIGDRHGQVKCLGRSCSTFGAGDCVTLYRQVDDAERTRRLDAAALNAPIDGIALMPPL